VRKRETIEPEALSLDFPAVHIGKGPRAIATRPACKAVEKATILHSYVCATPKRSATYLILSLMVEEAEDFPTHCGTKRGFSQKLNGEKLSSTR
jgi:hypothetical protein